MMRQALCTVVAAAAVLAASPAVSARLESPERFLGFNEQQVLWHAGLISHEMATAKAHAEFEKFRVNQDRDYLSDFDQAFARYLKGKSEE